MMSAWATELGLKPQSLLKNIPSPQQPVERAPVVEWLRELYEKRQRRAEQRRRRREQERGLKLRVEPHRQSPR